MIFSDIFRAKMGAVAMAFVDQKIKDLVQVLIVAADEKFEKQQLLLDNANAQIERLRERLDNQAAILIDIQHELGRPVQ